MQDRPTAPELLDSVAEYLVAELRPEVPREQRFKVLVAANVCTVVARESRAGEEPAASVADRRAGATVLAPASGRVEAAPPFQAGKAAAALR